MTNDQTQTFIDEVLDDARAAASHLGVPVSPILAQWINETGSGTSDAWRNGNNYAGVSQLEPFQVSLGAHYGDQGVILFYPSRQNGLAGYIGRWADGVYDSTRAKFAAANHDARAVAQAIEESPWAAGHYSGDGLRQLIMEHNLTQYDGAAPVQGGGDGPGTPCAALRPGPAPQGHTTLKIGARGDEVKEVQLRLIAAGITPHNTLRPDGSVDGIFGGGTSQAVADFQTEHGLHRDGIVGRQTWCALGVR